MANHPDEFSLPAQDQQALEFIHGYIAKHGFGPAIREVGQHLGMASPNNAKRIVDRLNASGLIATGRTGTAGHPRILRPMISVREPFKKPIVGIVAAGEPIASLEPGTEEFDFDATFGGEDVHLIRVRGDSMVGDCIKSGDVVAVRRYPEVTDGDEVVCEINGEYTLKVYMEAKGKRWLCPCSTKHEPIELSERSDIRVIGALVGVARRHHNHRAKRRAVKPPVS